MSKGGDKDEERALKWPGASESERKASKTFFFQSVQELKNRLPGTLHALLTRFLGLKLQSVDAALDRDNTLDPVELGNLDWQFYTVRPQNVTLTLRIRCVSLTFCVLTRTTVPESSASSQTWSTRTPATPSWWWRRRTKPI